MKFLNPQWIALLICSFVSFSAMANDDQGTELESKINVKVNCESEVGVLNIRSILWTTGSVAPTELQGLIANKENKFTYQDTIRPQDFYHDGRYKWTQSFWNKLKAKNGDYWAQACYLQKGSPGRQEKSVCSKEVKFSVSCTSGCKSTLEGQWQSCRNNGSDPLSTRIRIKADASHLTLTVTDFKQADCQGEVDRERSLDSSYALKTIDSASPTASPSASPSSSPSPRTFLLTLSGITERAFGCDPAYSQLEFGESCDKFRISNLSCDSSKLEPFDDKKIAPFYKTTW